MPNTHHRSALEAFRRKLASLESVPQFAILGILSGAVTGLVILAFRTAVEVPLAWLLGGDHEAFESLPVLWQGLLPIAGALVIGLVFSQIPAASRLVGVVYVLRQLQSSQGYMSLRNASAQFIGAMLAFWSGQSVGREGPAIHLGAAASSGIGALLHLPDNSIRVLVGCGAAAAIAASFNTPIAGVIFSMEVIILEYTISGFVPVILAATTATLINQVVYGNAPAFVVPPVSMNSFFDLPFLLFEGVAIGMLAACFIFLVRFLNARAPSRLWQRYLLAGAVTGTAALAAPEVLGIGYDTVDQALAGSLPLVLLLLICALKLVTSATSVAMGIPAGLIGPTLFIGAAAGGLIGVLGEAIAPDHASSAAFYVALGMGAMMGAVLQAPLGALMAVMELTHNANIILPAMLVIVTANLTASHLFRQRSIFLNQMDMLGLSYEANPVSQVLDRTSVASVMTQRFFLASVLSDRAELVSALDANADTDYALIQDTENRSFILEPGAVRDYLDAHPEADTLDLSKIDATKQLVAEIREQATLKDALRSLNSSGANALAVTSASRRHARTVGIATREQVSQHLQH